MPSFDSLQQFQDMAPAAITVLWVVVAVVGLTMWLSGKRLARPACAVSGLLLGGLGGLTLGQTLAEEGAMALPLMIGTAIVGAILATFMFRVWMALSGAVLLAVVVPAASMIWLGTAPPEVAVADEPSAIEEITEKITEKLSGGTSDETSDESSAEVSEGASGGASGGTSGGLWAQAQETAHVIYEKQVEILEVWWDELGTRGRTFVMVSALVGAGMGLLLGLILPNVSAALQSAAVGTVLIFFAGRELLLRYLPDSTSWLPTTPRQTLLVMGLITLAGLIIQWILFRRRAEK